MTLLRCYIFAIGPLFIGAPCDAFLVLQKRTSRVLSTAVASSTGYLDSLSPPKALPDVPLPALAESPVEETFTSSAITLAADEFVETSGDATDLAAAPPPQFQYVPVLNLCHADAIADKVIECCERNEFNPITVHVLDASGSTLVSKRMDGCSPVGVAEFAQAKAYSCIVNKYPSRAFRDRYTKGDVSAKFCQMTSMVAVSGNQMAPFPGGVLLKVGDVIVGAVGVSGAAGDEDEYCAIRGVYEVHLGIATVPAKPMCSTMKDEL